MYQFTAHSYLFNRESGLVKQPPISFHSGGTGGDSFSLAVSGSGQWVAFASQADNLSGIVANPNAGSEIYVAWDSFGDLPVQRRVSVDSGEVLPNGDSSSPTISFNGRFVAFASEATNLLGVGQGQDTNVAQDIFLRDRDGNEDLVFDDPPDSTTTRVSVTSLGVEANGPSDNPSISADDGRFVAFESDATNLPDDGAPLDTNSVWDIFVRDRDPVSSRTFRVSVANDGSQANGPSFLASISADGRFVAFESDATNLVANDNKGVRDIFVRDTQAQATIRVSLASDGTEANGPSYAPAISANGRFVAFHSDATNLLGPGVDTNGQTDVFVYDLGTGDIFRASINSAGGQATGGPSLWSAISDDGRFVAFESDATNLVAPDSGGFRDIFFRDRGDMCPADFDGDGDVDSADLAELLSAWGPVMPCPPLHPADLVPDCEVDSADLAELLAAWGPCP